MQTLIIGGTRNLGPGLVTALLARGDRVTVLHRGQTRYSFPQHVDLLHADRSDPHQLAATLAGRSYDLVIDTTLYTGPDAETVVSLLIGRVSQYLMLSTGQVYLVRESLETPFDESHYSGPTQPPPANTTPDFSEWTYGIEKRAAEDVLFAAHQANHFPVTILRLPMVNSERDHFQRIPNYLARLNDGGPILVPAYPHLSLRHIYGGDVVQAVLRASQSSQAIGNDYNISQDETVSIDQFLLLLSQVAERPLHILRPARESLDSAGLLPACSPFSDKWMSALTNEKSKQDLAMRYTPLPKYLAKLVTSYRAHGNLPEGYRQRSAELELAAAI